MFNLPHCFESPKGMGNFMKELKGKEVRLSDLEQYVETTKIGDMTFVVLKFYRVTKHSGLKIMFVRVGDNFYGGMRYDDSMDEEKVRFSVANKYMDGIWWDATSDLKLHENLGRKIEELEGVLLMSDCQLPELCPHLVSSTES